MPKESAPAPIFLDQNPTVRIHPEVSDVEMTAQRERDLVEKAISGCADSYGAWFEHHRPAILRKVKFMVTNSEDAHDIVSHVSEKSFQAMPRFKITEVPPKAFLFRVAHNEAISHLRKMKPVSGTHDGLKDEKNSGFDDEVIREIDSKNQKEAIRNAVLGLKPEYSDVIRMRFLEKMEYVDVAKKIGKTTAAVRVIQFRALATLRKIVSEEPLLATVDVCDTEGVA